MAGPWQIFMFIIGSAVVIFGAYFATYLIARGSQKAYKGRAIRVLDRFSLSKDKSVVVLAIYGKIYVVAFAAGAVTLLDTPDAAAITELADAEQPASPIDSFRTMLKKRQEKADQDNAVDAVDKEDILK